MSNFFFEGFPNLVVGLARREPGLRQGAASSLPEFVSGWGGTNPGASFPDSSVTTTPGESSGRLLLAENEKYVYVGVSGEVFGFYLENTLFWETDLIWTTGKS